MSTIPLNLETDTVVLPDPLLPPGATLEQALRRRHSSRSFAQNVSLCCAGLGLGTVVRGLVDRPRLAPALGLGLTQRIALAQSVGYSGPGA